MMSETDDLREATREAHAAMKDMRALMKQCQGVIAELHTACANDVDEMVAAEVNEGLERYRNTLDQGIADAEKAIFERFDHLRDVLLGETREFKRKHQTSIPELIEALKNGRTI